MAIHYVEQSLHKLQKLYHQKAYHEVIDEAKKLLKSSAIKQNRTNNFTVCYYLAKVILFRRSLQKWSKLSRSFNRFFYGLKCRTESPLLYADDALLVIF